MHVCSGNQTADSFYGDICQFNFLFMKKKSVVIELNYLTFCFSEILAAKKKKYTELARSINQTKTEIDASRIKLDRLKDEREATGEYPEDLL